MDKASSAQQTDPDSDDEENQDGGGVTKNSTNDQPSAAALAKLDDFMIPYKEEQYARAASKNPHLKLLWNLLGFQVADRSESGVLFCLLTRRLI